MRQATRRPGDKLNILTGITHERQNGYWNNIHAHFWLLSGLPGFKESWNERYASLPSNFTILPPCRDGTVLLPDDVVPDLVLAQHRFGQFQALKKVADYLHVPLMTVEHTLPRSEWSPAELAEIKKMRGDLNVFITADNRAAWGWGDDEAIVIEHGIDTEMFVPGTGTRHTKIITVANDYIGRGDILGFDIWKEATRDLPVLPIGDTPSLSESAPSVESLAGELAAGSIFLCTARSSPIPMSLLEAMSAEMACVAIRQSTVASVIKHCENGLLADNAAEIRYYLFELRKNPSLRQQLGQQARQTILDRFPLGRFRSEWETAFQQTANLSHQP